VGTVDIIPLFNLLVCGRVSGVHLYVDAFEICMLLLAVSLG
jgi:hypothetical protein